MPESMTIAWLYMYTCTNVCMQATCTDVAKEGINANSFTMTHIHIHTRIHTYTYIHTCMHTYIHADHVYIQIMHTYRPYRSYQSHSLYIQIIYTYMHAYVRTYIHTYIHTHIHTYKHTYVRTYIHTYIHT